MTDTADKAAGALARGYGLLGCSLLAVAAWTVVVLEGLDKQAVWGAALNIGGINILAGLGMVLLGLVLIAHHVPRSLGWLLLSGGTGRVLAEAVAAVASETANPVVLIVVVVVVAVSVTAYYLALYATPLFLPGGRLPGRGAAAYVGVLAVLSTVQGVRDTLLAGDWYTINGPVPENIFSAANNLDPWNYPLMRWVPAAAAGISLTVMAVCWRRSATRYTPSAPLLIPYLLWLLLWLSSTWIILPSLPLWGADGIWYSDGIWYAVAALWPTMLGYAAARDRSRHLDRSTRRVLSYFLLATALVTGYLVLTVLAYLMLRSSPAARPLAIGTAALALGAMLRPTTRWSARVVDRYYYGKRAKPYQSVRALAEQLSKAADPAGAPRVLCATAVDTLGLPGACPVAHGRDGDSRELAVVGTDISTQDTGSLPRFPLSHRGAVIGYLIVAPRPGEQALDRQDTEAVRLLAAHAAPAVAAVLLYEDLQHSHQELLLAREEERRRLRYELHDGLGPALSGLRLQIDSVRSSCPTQFAALLQGASTELGDVVDELRHITHGLAPAALDRHNLPAALRQLADRLASPGLRIDVILNPQPFPPLAAELETALYRIAAEALNNVNCHAHADQVRLLVDITSEGVDLTISDNGCGLSPGWRAGVGLSSMTRRAEELGGTISITRPTGQGTTVDAQFPASRIRQLTEPPTNYGQLPAARMYPARHKNPKCHNDGKHSKWDCPTAGLCEHWGSPPN